MIIPSYMYVQEKEHDCCSILKISETKETAVPTVILVNIKSHSRYSICIGFALLLTNESIMNILTAMHF